MKVEIRTKTLAEEVLKLIKLDRQITETTTNDEKSKSIVGLDLINKVIFDSRSALFNMTSPMSSSSLTRPRNDNDELNNNNNNNEDDDDDDDDDRSSSFSNKRLKTASSSSSSSSSAAAVVASTTTTANNFVVRKLEYTKDSTKTNDELHQSIDICPVMNALVGCCKYFHQALVRMHVHIAIFCHHSYHCSLKIIIVINEISPKLVVVVVTRCKRKFFNGSKISNNSGMHNSFIEVRVYCRYTVAICLQEENWKRYNSNRNRTTTTTTTTGRRIS